MNNIKGNGIVVVIDSQKISSDDGSDRFTYSHARIYSSESMKSNHDDNNDVNTDYSKKNNMITIPMFDFMEVNVKHDSVTDESYYTINAMDKQGYYLNVNNEMRTMSNSASIIKAGIISNVHDNSYIPIIMQVMNPKAIVNATIPEYASFAYSDDYGSNIDDMND